MDAILKISEASEDIPATVQFVHQATKGWLSPVRLQLLAMELWGYLNFNLTGEARPIFENVGDLQGFEAWRKLVKGIRSRAEVRKLALSGKVQRPAEAKRLTDVPKALETWDTDMREFLEAGGRSMSFDERKLALLNIVPEQIPADIMIRLHMFPEPPPGSSQSEQDESFT